MKKIHISNTNTVFKWHRIFGEARTRILIWYILLMSFFTAVAIPAIRQRLFAEVETRVKNELATELTNFAELVNKGMKNQDSEVLQRLQEKKAILSFDTPSYQQKLSAIFDVYLYHHLPEDDTFLIAFLEGEFYQSSPRALPKILNPNSELMKNWAQLSQRQEGESEFPNSGVGNVLYAGEPIVIDGKRIGVFVVAHTTAGERGEALEALRVVIEVTIVVLAIAFFLAWIAAGKVLAPLRLLTTTAQSISESDLTQRIPVEGKGEIAELATTFNEMMDRLQAAFDTQRNLINDAGHELRTPITIIRGHLELIGDDPQEQQETLTLVIDELDRMSRLVDDLLLLAKAERPDFLLLETVDVATLTEELFAKAKALAPRNWILERVAKAKIVADRQRLTEAIMNLAQNATQHTSSYDTIALGSSISKNLLSFWVRDTGEGIAVNEQERIFKRFARGSNSRNRSQGSGLGLSIVLAIVEAHHGKVFVKSQLGEGSTFTIVLPLE